MFWLNLSNPKRLNGNVYCTVFAVSRLKLFYIDLPHGYLNHIFNIFEKILFLKFSWNIEYHQKVKNIFIYLFIYNFLH